VRACGGIAMMRVEALASVGGFRDDLIAGEEPELCARLRGAGWRIWRLNVDMALHHAAMPRFGQRWRRAVRTGYAFAQGAHLHCAGPHHHGSGSPGGLGCGGCFFPLLAFWLDCCSGLGAGLYEVLRQIVRNPGTLRQRVLIALFQVLARFPEGWGQLKFMGDRLFWPAVRPRRV